MGWWHVANTFFLSRLLHHIILMHSIMVKLYILPAVSNMSQCIRDAEINVWSHLDVEVVRCFLEPQVANHLEMLRGLLLMTCISKLSSKIFHDNELLCCTLLTVNEHWHWGLSLWHQNIVSLGFDEWTVAGKNLTAWRSHTNIQLQGQALWAPWVLERHQNLLCDLTLMLCQFTKRSKSTSRAP